MKVEYLNALVRASDQTCTTMLGITAAHGKLTVKSDASATTADITAILGLSGKVRGSIVLAFSHDAAAAFVKKFLGNAADLSRADICDGVGELCNIIGGSAKVELNKFGLDLSISIPNVLVGKGLRVANNASYPTLVIPCDTPIGSFAMEICLVP